MPGGSVALTLDVPPASHVTTRPAPPAAHLVQGPPPPPHDAPPDLISIPRRDVDVSPIGVRAPTPRRGADPTPVVARPFASRFPLVAVLAGRVWPVPALGERTMSSERPRGQADPAAPGPAPVGAAPMTRWQKFRLVVKVVELRLRFVALMAGTALVFAYWDDLWNRYDKWTRPAAGRHAAVSGIEYYCPMHPQVVQDAPGTCPICGMPLARRKKGEKATLPAGVTARVELAPFRVGAGGHQDRRGGVRPADADPDHRRLRRVRRAADRQHHLQGPRQDAGREAPRQRHRPGRRGRPDARRAVQPRAVAGDPGAAQRGPARGTGRRRPQTAVGRSLAADRQEMVRAAAEKLRRWGITQAQIDEILKKGETDFTIPILSPIRGHVFKKNVVEGQEVQEGYAMFEVADLHTVWVQAQVYEHQLGLIRQGQAVEAAVEAFPGETFPGKVEFIQPHLDPATRTVEVRFALDNPGHRLRPGMFATVTLKTSVADRPFGAAVTAADLTAEHRSCPVTTQARLDGRPGPGRGRGAKVWTCCAACPPKLKAQPARYLARLAPAPGRGPQRRPSRR